MNSIRIMAQIGILWVFYFIGELIVAWTGIFIPGSIIGLLILWILLMLNVIDVKIIRGGATFMIAFLTLFFIPSTVGIIQYPELLTKPGILLMVAVFVSSLISLILTGKFSQYIERKELEGANSND